MPTQLNKASFDIKRVANDIKADDLKKLVENDENLKDEPCAVTAAHVLVQAARGEDANSTYEEAKAAIVEDADSFVEQLQGFVAKYEAGEVDKGCIRVAKAALTVGSSRQKGVSAKLAKFVELSLAYSKALEKDEGTEKAEVKSGAKKKRSAPGGKRGSERPSTAGGEGVRQRPEGKIEAVSPLRMNSLTPVEWKPQGFDMDFNWQAWRAELDRIKREIRQLKGQEASTKWKIYREEKAATEAYKNALEKDLREYRQLQAELMKDCKDQQRADEIADKIAANKEDHDFKREIKKEKMAMEQQALASKMEMDKATAEWNELLMNEKVAAKHRALQEKKDNTEEIKKIRKIAKEHERLMQENERQWAMGMDLDCLYKELQKQKQAAEKSLAISNAHAKRSIPIQQLQAFAGAS